jgi:hypothetical protein
MPVVLLRNSGRKPMAPSCKYATRPTRAQKSSLWRKTGARGFICGDRHYCVMCMRVTPVLHEGNRNSQQKKNKYYCDFACVVAGVAGEMGTGMQGRGTAHGAPHVHVS